MVTLTRMSVLPVYVLAQGYRTLTERVPVKRVTAKLSLLP